MQNVKQAFPDRTPRYAGKMLDGPERSRMRKVLLEAGQPTVGMTDQQIIGQYRTLNPHAKLDKYLPKPKKAPAKRWMVAVNTEAYDAITDMAVEMKTTRGLILLALVRQYKAKI